MFNRIKELQAKNVELEDRREELYDNIDALKDKNKDLNEKFVRLNHEVMEKDIIISKIGNEEDKIIIFNLQKSAQTIKK